MVRICGMHTSEANWEVYGKAQEGISEGSGVREAVGKYSYHCPTNGPQPHCQRRSLTMRVGLPQPNERVAGGGTPPRPGGFFIGAPWVHSDADDRR